MHKSLIGFLLLLVMSCHNIDYSGKGNDVPTQGDLAMGVDYGDSFLLDEWMYVFTVDYPKAHLTPKYLCETEIMNQLESGKLSFAMLHRDFTAEEKENFNYLEKSVRSVRVARTSIAVVAHPNIVFDSIQMQELKDMLAGDPKLRQYTCVFDQGCGSNYNYFSSLWFNKGGMKGRIIGKKTPAAVLDYVSKTPNAIGFVSVNWVSDRTDSLSQQLAKSVKILKIENPKKGKFYYPFQSQIKANEYPFIQEIWMHDLQGYSGLAQGFIAWVSSQPGQILVKKSGLIPEKDMGRTIELSTE